VSLLEVLFSIGVVLVGLVGIAMSIPIGGALARKGVVADAAAQLSSNGAREFSTRGMANKLTWRWHDGTRWVQHNGTVWGWNNGGAWQPVPLPDPGSSFCLDPQFIATPQANLPAEMVARNKFPLTPAYGDPNVLWMPRITLGSSVANPLGFVISKAAADRIFLGNDDLIFDLPDDRTLGPVQNFSQELSSLGPMTRQTAGTLTWMATIVPALSRVQRADGNVGFNVTDQYTLSIVVFDRRLVPREMIDTSGNLVPESTISERVVNVVNFYSGPPAFSGGDVTLESRATRSSIDGADDLELRPGDWVMLSRLQPVMPHPNTAVATVIQVQVHKWYRVVQVDAELVANGTRWQRDVTLVGPDWDYDLSGTFPTRATIARGVVEVHEKTIRLETSSLWAN
jgi:hypothetical protein